MSCLYCGKKRGLALFKKDGFCSAEHRRLWEERESSNLVQRLVEARGGGDREPIQPPQQRPIAPAAAELSAGETVKRLEDGKATPASEVGIVITRQSSVVPVTETPRPTPPEAKATDLVPRQSVELERPVVRRVTPVRTVPKQTVPKQLEPPRIPHEEVRQPARPSDVPAQLPAGEPKDGRCLYCGKKQGLALFRRDDFCSAEHRRLWESANLVQRLIEARDSSERQPLRLPQRPSIDDARDTSPSAVLRELQASIGQPAASPSDEIVSTPPAAKRELPAPIGQHVMSPSEENVSAPPAAEPVTETSPVEPADPVAAGFILPAGIQLEQQVAAKNRPIWTADALLEAPTLAIFLPSSRAVDATGFAGSQTGLRIHVCSAGSIANVDKRRDPSWPGRAPFDTALVVESRKPGPWNSIEMPVPIQAVKLDQTTFAESIRRSLSYSSSTLSRLHDVTASSRTPELILATSTVTPAFSILTHSTTVIDMVPAGEWPVRTFSLPIGSVATGLTDAKFVKLPTQHLSAYSRAGVSVRPAQSFRPSIPSRALEPQLITCDYHQLPSSFIAPGASKFLALPAVAGREINIGIDLRGRAALPGSRFTSLPFQPRVTVRHRPTISAAALLTFAIPSRAAEHKLAIAKFTIGTLPRLALTAPAVALGAAAVSQLRTLAIASRAAEHKLAIARFTVGTMPKLALQASSVSPAVTLKALQEAGRLRPALSYSAFVGLTADKPAAVEVARGADARDAKNTWIGSLRKMFRGPRFDPSASIPSKEGGDQGSNLSGGLSGLETSERVWAKSLLLPVSSRSDLARHAAIPCKLVLGALAAGRTETSESRLRPDLNRRAWFSSPLLIERREHALPAILNASDRQVNGVAFDPEAAAPQPSSPSKRTPCSHFQPLSLAQRSIELQDAMVSHAQAPLEMGLQSRPQTPVVLSVKAPPAYTPQIERTGQGRRNAQFVPIVLEQQLEYAAVRMIASVSRLRLPGLSGRMFKPTLAFATYEQYPETLSFANVRSADRHGIGTSRSANSAIDSVRQGLANPGFLPFDIEQPLMQEQTQATLSWRPAPDLTYIPLRDGGKQIYLAAAAETWCEPIELCDSSLLTLESLLPPSATNSILPSLCILKPSDTSSPFAFKHLQVAAATSPWHDASSWDVPKVRLHDPLIALRDPSCRSLISWDSRPSRSDSAFKLTPFSHCEYGPGTVNQPRPELTPNIITSDFTGDSDLEMLEMVLATGDADFEPTETVEATEPLDTPARTLPGLFVAALQERFYPMSFSVQRSYPQWLKPSVMSTNAWVSNPVHQPPHDVADQTNFWNEALKQSGVRAFGPFRMGANAQPELQWAPCRTSTRRQ